MSSAKAEHPDASQILRLLDGELSEAEARQVERHLEICWQCRAQRNETQAAIDAFVRYREKVLLAGIAPPGGWPDLRVRCEAFDEAHQTARRPWPVWRLVAAGAMGLALLAVTIVLRERPEPAPVARKAMAPPEPHTAMPRAAIPARVTDPGPRVERGLLAIEVEVWERLHAAGADLGEPVEVETSSAEVLVRTMALEPTRTDEIRRAIAGIEGARLIELEPPAAQAGAEAGSAVTPRPMLFAGRLRSHLGSDAAREEFANTVLDMGEAIMARAHALQRLEVRFAGQALRAREMAAIRRMETDHRDVLRRQAEELRRLLAGVFPEEPAPVEAPRPLGQTARTFDEAISAAFAGAQSRYSDAELLLQLQGALRELAQ